MRCADIRFPLNRLNFNLCAMQAYVGSVEWGKWFYTTQRAVKVVFTYWIIVDWFKLKTCLEALTRPIWVRHKLHEKFWTRGEDFQLVAYVAEHSYGGIWWCPTVVDTDDIRSVQTTAKQAEFKRTTFTN